MAISHDVTSSSGQEWQFHMLPPISSSRMAISHASFTFHHQEWQFHIATDI